MRVSKQRMAEIKNRDLGSRLFLSRQIFIGLLILLFQNQVDAQSNPQNTGNKQYINLKHTDLLVQSENAEGPYKRLLGHDTLIQGNVVIICDSAHLYTSLKRVYAYSRVHINQADTLDLYGDYLQYDGITRKAFIKGNVELIDKKTHLYTKTLNYDANGKIASYTDSGKIINAKNTLTSRIGYYNTSQKMFHFKDSVKIVNPDYVMTADTMDYNTETETAFFTGPSRVKGDSLNLYCEKGWYDTKKDITSISQKSYIDNKKQLVRGDSLFFNNKTGYGEAFRNVSISDTSYDVIVEGNYAWYYKKPEKFLVTDSAVFIQVSKGDSLFLHADTISAVSVPVKVASADTSGKSFRLVRAFHKCRIYSKGLQAKCDSLSYSFQDSVIRLYKEPVLWSESNQMTSDSIAIFTKNREADVMELYNSAFIASQVDSIRFNQIKGRNMKGFFKKNKLYKLSITGNGESIYFLVDKEGQIGWNRSKSSSMEIYVDNGKISEIYEYQNPEGTLNPPMQEPDKQRLPGFNWQGLIRPKDRNDIFRK
jgi:lipopolysaccharide export system protein LptA